MPARLIRLVLSVALFVAWFRFLLALDSQLARPVLALVLVFGALGMFAFSVAAHEVGHVVAGLAAGLRFHRLQVGPFALVVRAGRTVPEWNTRLRFAGGIGTCLPVNLDRLGAKLAQLLAGGPLVSLVLFFGSGAWAYAHVHDGASGVGPLLASLCAVMNGSILISSLVPGVSSGLMSDGMLLGMLARGGAERERYLALVEMSVQLNALGLRPRDLSRESLARARSLPDGSSHHLSANLLAYRAELDRGEIAEAQARLEEALRGIERLPGPFRSAVRTTAAYFYAAHRHDAAAARAQLADSAGGIVEAADRALAEAATLAAEGRAPEARDVARRGLAAAVADASAGSARLTRERLEAYADGAGT